MSDDRPDRDVVDAMLAEAGLASDDRYIRIPGGEKGARFDHTDPANREATPPETGNYGIYATGADRLVVLDVDESEDTLEDTTGLDALEELRDQEPTLTQVSPHGGVHLIYRVETDGKGRLPAGALEHRLDAVNVTPSWGDLRVRNGYVLGAGSQLDGCDKDGCDRCSTPGGGTYDVPDPRPVATITFDRLFDVLGRDPDLGREEDQNDLDDVDTGDREPAEDVKEILTTALDHSEDHRLSALWRGPHDDRSEAECALALKIGWWIGSGRSTAERKRVVADVLDGKHTPDGWGAPHAEKWNARGEEYRESVLEAVERVSDPYDPYDGDPPDDRRSWREIVADESDEFDSVEDVPETFDELFGSSPGVDLSPAGVYAVAEISGDEDISDLNDRERAAAVWRLIRETDDFHIRVRRDNSEVWAFDPETGTWDESGERALRHAARQALGARYFGRNVVEELKAQARADPTAEIERGELGVGRDRIAVANGLLRLDVAREDPDDALRPLEPEDLALSRLPVEFVPGADAPAWRSFVDDVVESQKIDAVQEYVGYALDRRGLPYQKALLCVGSGSNGKSTLLNTVKKLLGTENVTNTPLHKFEDDDRVAGLFGSLANIDADLSDASLSRDGVSQFKRLTGDDPVEGRRLYEDAFTFDPIAKHLYAANQVPDVSGIVDDNESAFWRRWIIVNFPRYIRPAERDPDLDAKLADELPGILNWALEGYHRLRDQGEFTDVESEPETRRLWKSWGESADEFLVEYVEQNDDLELDERLTTSELWEVYSLWCSRTERDACGQRELTMKIKKDDRQLGYSESVRIPRTSTSTPRGYSSLSINHELQNLVDEVLEDDDDDRDSDDSQSSLV